MKNKIIHSIMIVISLLLLNCQSNINTSNNVIDNKGYFHFEFKKLDTINIVKCFGQTLANQVATFSSSELSGVYIVEIQNNNLDSLLIPCNYSRGIPVYYSNKTEYFRFINDTLPINVDLPFNIPTNVERLLKNEKKCFLTPLKINGNIAKIEYSYYVNNDNMRTQFKAILTKQNNALIDMTKY
jgi:hypothetical protein